MEGLDPNLLLAQMGKKDGEGDDKTLWLFLLLMMGGRNGFGGGNDDKACCPPATLEQMNDMQNALTAQATNNNNNASDHFLQSSDTAARNQLASQLSASGIESAIAAANSQNLVGQKDLTAAIAQCCCNLGLSIKDVEKEIAASCCETRNAINVQGLQTQNAIQFQGMNTVNAIDKCCCETQNSIAIQTTAITQAICNDGQATRTLITDNRMQDLQSQLGISRDDNSNLRQTAILSEQIRAACCQPCQPCSGGGHNGGGH